VSIDLLNATHDFPTAVMIKAIGWNERAFVERIIEAVRDSLEQPHDPPYRVRETPGGRHVAVTLEPYMTCAEQVLAVYARLRTVEGVVMLL